MDFTTDSENAYLFSVNFHGGCNLRLIIAPTVCNKSTAATPLFLPVTSETLLLTQNYASACWRASCTV